jgi:hypothetical protein
MTTFETEKRSCRSVSPLFRRVSAFLACLLCTSAFAQVVTITETYSVPHYVDGSSMSAFFNFAPQLGSPAARLISTELSLTFDKYADLYDDPPFYSDIGIVLRELNSDFSIRTQATLVEVGTLPDGSPGSFFSGTITFSDSAETYVNSNPDELFPGIYRPEQPLSWFEGLFSPFWELRIDDASSQNPLLFSAATLALTVATANAVPEPSAYGLMAALLLGFALLHRRIRSASN